MSLDKYLSEKNGIFQNATELQNSEPNIGNIVAINESGVLTFYSVDATNNGSGLAFSNGKFANPINQKVIPQTVSGTLVAGGQINQIRDSGGFDFPLANSVDAEVILVVELPRKYTAQTPVATRSGLDLLEDENGTDTSVTWAGAARLTFTSNGVDRWSL